MVLFSIPIRRACGRRPILSDRRGATIVEFALVATPFLLLLIAIIQTSRKRPVFPALLTR